MADCAPASLEALFVSTSGCLLDGVLSGVFVWLVLWFVGSVSVVGANAVSMNGGLGFGRYRAYFPAVGGR